MRRVGRGPFLQTEHARRTEEAGFLDPPLRSDLRRYCDCDPIGLGFLTQRQPDGQHTGLVLSADFGSVDRRRQRERPRERAITALDAMKQLLGDFRVELLFAAQRERVVFDCQLDLLFWLFAEVNAEFSAVERLAGGGRC